MAIDTQQKRQSAAGCGRPFMRTVFPVSAKDEPWRHNVGLTYSGNAYTGGGPPPTQDGKMVTPRRHFHHPAEILG